MNWEIFWIAIGCIISILALAGAIVWHLFGTVWWMSKITTKIDSMVESIKELKKTQTECVIKETCIGQMSDHSRQLERLWEKVDAIKK